MSDRIGNGNGNGLVGADDDASSATFSGADSSALDGKLMVGAIVALFLVILFILALHIYSRFFWRRSYSRELSRQRRRRQRLHFSGGNGQDPPPARRGLDKATIDAMPVFTYDPAMFAVHEGQNEEEEEGAGVLECAVCLEEFEEGQKGRILPKCGHRFHTECIDMWFFSHSNCPLCRAPVVWSDLTSPPLVSDETGTRELTAVELASRGLLVGSSSSTSSSSVPAGGLRRQQTPQHIAIEIPSRDSGLALTSPASGRRSLRSRVPSGRFHASEIQQQQSDNDYHGGTNACSSSSTSEPLLKSSPASAPPPQTPRSFKSFKRMLSRDRKSTPAPPYPDSDAGIGPSGS